MDGADLNNSMHFSSVGQAGSLSLPVLLLWLKLGPELRFFFFLVRSDASVSVLQVMQVVREQITRTLSSKPTSLELFKNKVNALNYSEILKLRQTERLHQEETLAPPVL